MFGKYVSCQYEKQKLVVSFEERDVVIEPVTDAIWNVFSEYEHPGHRSAAIEGDKRKEVACSVKEGEDWIEISTRKACARICKNGYIDFLDKNGQVLCADYRKKRQAKEGIGQAYVDLVEGESRLGNIEAAKELDRGDCIYGLGDKTGFLNKRCYEYEMWNTDDPKPQEDNFKALYKSIPFFIVLKEKGVYGLFFDNHSKTYFDLGKTQPDCLRYGADGGNLDYYFISGDAMADVVEGYTYLTGRCPLPQLWTLGYHQSRWGYRSQEDIRKVAGKLRSWHIPCDCIHFDIDYMEDYKVFTWNRAGYKDPKALLGELKDQGFKAVTIMDPGVKVEKGYPIYETAMEKGYFATDAKGEAYENQVWPGDASYPDFGREEVRKWWAGNHKFLTGLGVSGIWNDMNEPASFRGPLPDDLVFYDEERPSVHKSMHNVYGHHMARATYAGILEQTQKRPFIITRACYSGSQKYATVWTGDNHSIWSHLRMAIPQLCNLGLSGFPFGGTDVGGFGSDVTEELLIRWYQVGCFSPLFRNHSALGTRNQEPWEFGSRALDIIRRYINLRYQLLPYFYDLFYESQKSGMPVMRPLVLQYEKDENVRNLNDEFLVGDSILVSPVVENGAVKKLVYLPEGIWLDYWTLKEYRGGRHYIGDAPLETCPIYVKKGAVIPKYPVREHVGREKDDLLILEAYGGEGTYVHYQDNGQDFAYERGEYNLYEFTCAKEGGLHVKMLHEGYPRYREIKMVSRL